MTGLDVVQRHCALSVLRFLGGGLAARLTQLCLCFKSGEHPHQQQPEQPDPEADDGLDDNSLTASQIAEILAEEFSDGEAEGASDLPDAMGRRGPIRGPTKGPLGPVYSGQPGQPSPEELLATLREMGDTFKKSIMKNKPLEGLSYADCVKFMSAVSIPLFKPVPLSCPVVVSWASCRETGRTASPGRAVEKNV